MTRVWRKKTQKCNRNPFSQNSLLLWITLDIKRTEVYIRENKLKHLAKKNHHLLADVARVTTC